MWEKLAKEILTGYTRVEHMTNPDHAYLLGALRDGSVYHDHASRNYVTVFYQKHRTWLEKSIAKRLIKLFGVNCQIGKYKPGHWRARVYSKKLYTLWQTEFEYPQEGTTPLTGIRQRKL